jgi:hypothetical protein
MRFSAELWPWQARADSWWFVTVPEELSADIAELPRPVRGFGSVRVRVTIGGSAWQTSVFPDSTSGCYVLPVKKAVREKEQLGPGDVVDVVLALVDV